VAELGIDALKRLAAAIEAGDHLQSTDLVAVGRAAPALLAALQRAETDRAFLLRVLEAGSPERMGPTTPEFDALWEEIRTAMAAGPAATRAPDGAELIAAERRRQIANEGWTPEHDDGHIHNQLARAAASYIAITVWPDSYEAENFWPWDLGNFKPTADPVRNLVKAGALIAAEIDRLQREAGR
jgi:hypothetical protein